MKQDNAKLVILYILVFLAFPGIAEGHRTPEQKLIVTMRNDVPPLNFIGVDGQPAGLFVDLWKLWAEKTGRDIEFQLGSLQDSLDSLKNRRADIHGSLLYSEEREEWMTFSQPLYELHLKVFYPIHGKILPLSELQGEKIGIVAGSAQEEYLRKNYPAIEIVRHENSEEMIGAAHSEKIKAFISTPSSILLHLNRLGLSAEFHTGNEILSAPPLHAGVLKDDSELLNAIDEGFAAISIEEFTAIERLWMPDPEYRYYQTAASRVLLTSEENAWLQRSGTVKIGIPEVFPPLMFQETGTFKGIIPDFLQTIGRMTGITFELSSVKHPEMFDRIRNRQIDMLPVFFAHQADETLMQTNTYLQIPWVVVNRIDEPMVFGVKDLEDKKVMAVRDVAIHDILKKEVPEIELATAETPRDALQAVAAGRADAFVGALPVVGHLLYQHRIANLKIAGPAGYPDFQLKFAIRSDTPELLSIINKAIRAIPLQEREKILHNWMAVRYQQVHWDFVREWVFPVTMILIGFLVLSLFWNNKLAREITERNRAEKRQAESERKFSTIFEAASVGIVQVDTASGEILHYNRKFKEIIGYPDLELLDKFFPELIHPEDRERDWQIFSGAMHDEKPDCQNEKRFIHKNDSAVWVRFNAAFIRDDAGKPICTIVVCEDITEQKREEIYRRLTGEVIEILNEEAELQDSIRRIVYITRKLTGFDAVGIRLQSGNDFPYFVLQGFPDDFLESENSLIARNSAGEICRETDGRVRLECTCGLVLSGKTDPENPLFTRGGSFWINDSAPLLDLPAEKDPRLNPRNRCIHRQYASVALIPIGTGEKIVGLLQLNDRQKGCFTLQTIEALERIARHIYEALARRHARAAISHEAAVNRALAEIAATLTLPGSSVPAISEVVHRYALSLTGSPHGYVSSIDPQTGENVGHTLSSMMEQGLCRIKEQRIAFPQEENSCYRGLYGHSLNTLESFFTNTPGSHPASRGLPEGHVPLERFLSVPAVYEGELYGQIALANTARDYTEEDLKVVGALAHLFAMAVFRKRAEDSLGESKKRLQQAHDALEDRVRERTLELSRTNEQLREEMEERRRAEEALRRSEEKYRIVADNTSGWEFWLDPQGQYVYVSPACEWITGHAPEEFVGDPDLMRKILHPEDLHRYLEHRHNAEKSKQVEMLIFRIIRPDGQERWIEQLCQPVFDNTDDYLGSRGSNRDITERKLAEALVLQGKKMLQSVFDGISEPLALIDRELIVRMVNMAAVSYFRLSSPLDLIGRVVCGDICERGEGCGRCTFPAAVSGSSLVTFVRAGFMDRDRVESVTIFPLPEEDGAEAGAVLRISDVTEAKMMEKSLLRTEKLASIGVLSSGVAHEINNPNNFIMFNVPVLRRYLGALLPLVKEHAAVHGDPAPFGMPLAEFERDLFELVESIEKGSERIKNIVAELKNFSGLDSQEETIWGNPAQTIAQAVRISRVQLKDRVKSLVLDIPPDLPEIYFEPRGLEQVIVNILINAVQAADKEDFWIHLKARVEDQEKGHFLIEIADNGCGIDEKGLKKIFDPFYTTKPPGLGTGLGLYVCHNLMQKMEGRINVESRVGQGTTFFLGLCCREMH